MKTKGSKKVDTLKKLTKYEKEILEGIIISIVGGWALTSILRGAYKQISNIQFPADGNFTKAFIMTIIFSIILGIIYYKNKKIAGGLMFVFTYIFLLLCAFIGYSNDWTTNAGNPIGGPCYQAILAFIAAIAFLYVKEDIYQFISELKIKRINTNIIVAIIGVLLFGFVGIVTVLRYKSYLNSTFDFGIFTQMYENMRQTGSVATTLERNRLLSHFGVHFSPIYYIALPIYFIFPSPVTVQLIQALMIALPVIPIVLIAREYRLSNWMTVGFTLLYALYPATSGGAVYDMHENCFLTFFLLMTIWAAEKKKTYIMILMMLFAFFVKEDAAIYVLVLGTFYLLSRKDKKRGLILMVCAAVYFLIAISVVNSYGLGIMDNRFSNLYFDADGGLSQVFKSIIANPGYVIAQMITNSSAASVEKIAYFILMFGPMATVIFTTGKKYTRYILLSPLIIINIFTTYVYMHDINFQYNFGVIALIMYLAIMNMADVKAEKAKTYVSIAVLCAGIMFVGNQFPKMPNYYKTYTENKSTYEKIDKALELVPTNASVCASGFFTPHLSKNLVLYDQNHLEQPVYTDYLVVDERFDNEKQKFDQVLSSGRYEIAYQEQGLISIYKKK